MWPALLGIGANIFSAISARKGQEQANRREMDFNAEQAMLDREWQERMSNTAFQRARGDLEEAGFNPLLALGHPASTPSGATASAHPKSERSEEAHILSNTAKNASEVALTQGLLNKTKADIGLASAQTALTDAHRRQADIEADFDTSGYGKFLMGVRKTLNSGIGHLAGGIGAGAMSAKLFRAIAPMARAGLSRSGNVGYRRQGRYNSSVPAVNRDRNNYLRFSRDTSGGN